MSLTPSSESNPCQVCGYFIDDCLQGQNQHYWECSTFFSLEEEGGMDTFEEGETINGFTFLGNTEDRFTFLSRVENSVRGRFCLGLFDKGITPHHHTKDNPCPLCLSEGRKVHQQMGGES